MRIWLACFFVLFALAQLFDWVKEFTLPLPIYILGGAFLVVASNYDKIFGSNLTEVRSSASDLQNLVTDATAEAPSEQPLLDSPNKAKVKS